MIRTSSDFSFFQPVVTFISIVVFGIILAQFIIPSATWKGPIIILSIIIGGSIAALEFRVLIKKSKEYTPRRKYSKEESKHRLAKYVANIFEEDIPFEETSQENTQDDESRNSDTML